MFLTRLTVRCFLCGEHGFHADIDSDYPGYMDLPIFKLPHGKVFKIRPFAEYPRKNDDSVPRPCVHFQCVELRAGGLGGGSYHRMDFGWDIDQVIYICPGCFYKKDETEVMFSQRLDQELIKRLDEKVLQLLCFAIKQLDLFAFAKAVTMRRRFACLSGGAKHLLRDRLDSIYPIFRDAHQERAGKTKKWMDQLAEIIHPKKKIRTCRAPR